MDIVIECRRVRQYLTWVKNLSEYRSERKRAGILLGCAAGLTQEKIATVVGCDRTTVVRTYQRWRQEGRGAVVGQRRFGHRQKPAAKIPRLIRKLCADQPSD